MRIGTLKETYIADAALYLMKTQPDLGITNPYELDDKQFQAAIDLLNDAFVKAITSKDGHDQYERMGLADLCQQFGPEHGVDGPGAGLRGHHRPGHRHGLQHLVLDAPREAQRGDDHSRMLEIRAHIIDGPGDVDGVTLQCQHRCRRAASDDVKAQRGPSGRILEIELSDILLDYLYE